MSSVYESMKKLIDKCDLFFEGHLISKERLLQDYAAFLAEKFDNKRSVVFALHTGSICFDIITVLFSTIGNVLLNCYDPEEYVLSLSIGDKVLYDGRVCRFDGIEANPYYRLAILSYETIQTRRKQKVTLMKKDSVSEEKWNKITPYCGDRDYRNNRAIRSNNKKRDDFLSFVFDIRKEDLPAFVEKSTVIVMSKDYADRIIDSLEIKYGDHSISLNDIVPISYCTDNNEYPYGGNPGRLEPAVKITSNVSNARSLIIGEWNGNDTWKNDVIGVSCIGFDAISRSESEVSEMTNRRKLVYTFLSYNIASEGGDQLLDTVQNQEILSVFACTAAFLSSHSAGIVDENPFTTELDKQVQSIVNHNLITLSIKTFDCDWDTYKKVLLSLSRLRHSGMKMIEDYLPLAYSMMNLMITSVFPLELMEQLIDNRILSVESPAQRLRRLAEMSSSFTGDEKETATSILKFLNDGYNKLFSVSPKEAALFDLLEQYRNKKVAIIVPKSYYAEILYSQNVLDYFENQTFLSISTANKFDMTQHYDAVIAIGAFWGKKFDPFRCYSATTVYVIASAVEENLLKYRKRITEKLERKYNTFANVSYETAEDDQSYYSDGVTEAEVSEIVESSIDVSAFINQIVTKKIMENLPSTGVHTGTTDVSYIATCADGESVLFTKKYKAYVFDSAKEDVVEVSVDRLASGDTVIFKSNNNETKDIVTELLDKYLAEYESTDVEARLAYLKSQYWKVALNSYRKENNLTYKELSDQLASFGSKRHEVTIQSWLAEDSYIVGPQDLETFIAIAKMTRDAMMMKDPQSFFDACDRIRRIRVGILKLIAKTIISKYSGCLTEDNDLARVVSANIDGISVLVQIETITPVENKIAPINMVNRPLLFN